MPVHADLPGVGGNLRCHAQCGLNLEAEPAFLGTGEEPPLQMGCRYTAAGSGLRNDMFLHPGSGAPRGGYYNDAEVVGFNLVASIYLAPGPGAWAWSPPIPGANPSSITTIWGSAPIWTACARGCGCCSRCSTTRPSGASPGRR